MSSAENTELYQDNEPEEGEQQEEVSLLSLSPSSKSSDFDKDVRSFNKLHFDPKMSHEKRREYTLCWQKKRRDELLDKIRQLENDSFSEDEMDESQDFVKIVEKRKNENHIGGNWTGRKDTVPTGKRWNAAKVMLSEWLEQKPDDFEEKWLGVLCPVGLRCLVVSTRGRTRVVTRRGYRIGEYQSCLPGGRRYRGWEDGTSARPRGVTILDCFWSEKSQIFYVLDLLCWNSSLCTDCDTEYRQFFLKSKLQENPEIMERTESNPFPFTPLPFFSVEELPRVMMADHNMCPENEDIDGVLFFHKESFYISGVNPCCLWILLSQIPERLSIHVSPELLAKEHQQQPKPPFKGKGGGKGKHHNKESKQMDIAA